jgi:hypothetical protein
MQELDPEKDKNQVKKTKKAGTTSFRPFSFPYFYQEGYLMVESPRRLRGSHHWLPVHR